LEENSIEKTGEQTKIKIKRSRRRLYEAEVSCGGQVIYFSFFLSGYRLLAKRSR
jgi:hypothetical protein